MHKKSEAYVDKCYIQIDKKNKAEQILSNRLIETCIEHLPYIINNISENIIKNIKEEEEIKKKKLKRIKDRRVI